MILDTLTNAETYARLHPSLGRALEIARGVAVDAPDERTTLPDGFKLMITTSTTKPIEDAPLEAHLAYLDLQMVLVGEECAYVAPLDTVTPSVPYNAEKDVAWYTGEARPMRVRAGEFFIVFPGDAHKAGGLCGEAAPLRKVVVKIPVF